MELTGMEYSTMSDCEVSINSDRLYQLIDQVANQQIRFNDPAKYTETLVGLCELVCLMPLAWNTLTNYELHQITDFKDSIEQLIHNALPTQREEQNANAVDTGE